MIRIRTTTSRHPKMNKAVNKNSEVHIKKMGDDCDVNENGYIKNNVKTVPTSEDIVKEYVKVDIICERVTVKYNKSELRGLGLGRNAFITACEKFEWDMEKIGDVFISDEQRALAKKICDALTDKRVINILAIAPPQGGKTGCMYATIKTYMSNINNMIDVNNVFIITGLSSRDWVNQTKKRFPEILSGNIYHRSDLTTFVKRIDGVSNVLIIMDEIQVAAKENQSIHKAFKTLGLLDKETLYERDIKIVEFTATPDGTIYDLMKWGEASRIIIASNCDDYTSSYDLLHWNTGVALNKIINVQERINTLEENIQEEHDDEEKEILTKKLSGLQKRLSILQKNKHRVRVKQYKNLWECDCETGELTKAALDAITELKDDIDSYSKPRYHIIRTKTGDQSTIDKFKEHFPDDIYKFINYDSGCKDKFNNYVRDTGKSNKVPNDKIMDINELLTIEPDDHTIIFTKEMLRCSKTTEQYYKGVSYERWVRNPNDSVTIQGMLGRNNGYKDNGDSICYTNIETIEKYKELLDSEFNRRDIKWNSNTTNYGDEGTFSTKTFNTLTPKVVDVSEPALKKEKVIKVKKEKVVREKTESVTREKNIPVIIGGFLGTERIFTDVNLPVKERISLKEREKFVLSAIKDIPEHERLYNYINNERVRIGKASLPEIDSSKYDSNTKKNSYDRHITDVVKAANNNKPYSVSGRHPNTNTWNLFIDAKYNRLCIIPLVIDKELY